MSAEYSVEEVRNAARLLDGLSRRMLIDYAERIKADEGAVPAWQTFFDKYAIGGLTAPSCFGCGMAWASWDGCTRHAELPSIFLCSRCAEKCKGITRPPAQAAQGEVVDEIARLKGMIERDRTVFCNLIAGLKRELQTREWLGDENARATGGYRYDEPGFIREFGEAWTAIMAALNRAHNTFRDFSDCPKGDAVRSAQAEAETILAAQPRAVPADRDPRGTFECPICGYDKPHEHAEDNQFPWHMQYREGFERIVRRKIRQVGGEFLFGGMRLNGHNQYLAYCGTPARQEGGWAELTRSGEYRNEWLQTLWSMFKDATLAAPSPGESE